MVLGLMRGVEIVGTARDGEEAIRLVEQFNPDIVLMDLRMPRCDGVEATRRITSGDSRTKVVAPHRWNGRHPTNRSCPMTSPPAKPRS
jgi:DNA-binding NarL/FixJ family response regulator